MLKGTTPPGGVIRKGAPLPPGGRGLTAGLAEQGLDFSSHLSPRLCSGLSMPPSSTDFAFCPQIVCEHTVLAPIQGHPFTYMLGLIASYLLEGNLSPLVPSGLLFHHICFSKGWVQHTKKETSPTLKYSHLIPDTPGATTLFSVALYSKAPQELFRLAINSLFLTSHALVNTP